MNIISYRGPGMAGGVSSALAHLWREHAYNGTWWHLSGTSLHATEHPDEPYRELTGIPQAVIDGHYRYCNEFLWPVMHDLPQYARFRAEDHKLYVAANRILTRTVLADNEANSDRKIFVQDYQLALMPDLLYKSSVQSLVFWHIPWPKTVDPQHVPPLMQIARSMVAAEIIGFHTAEYAENFLTFVHRHLHGLHVDFESSSVIRGRAVEAMSMPWSAPDTDFAGRKTNVVVAPLGIENSFWKNAAAIPQIRLRGSEFSWLHSGVPYVLSVDRADYTKGVLERFRAIDRFLERNPAWRARVNFVQLCGRTRGGIDVFDSYWNQCKVEAAKLESKWRTDHWSPLTWLEHPCTGAELSVLYRDAAAMLVNPVRDGLNLTAKEFVASQIRKPGVLILSQGAGAWHELNEEALTIDPHDADNVASALETALTMNQTERARRITRMNMRLSDNTLSDWWHQIAAQVAVSNTTSNSVVNNLRSVPV
ncbi:MAG: trehalose-6-phosphate synthase [Candidatus Obscuribacterales bacterium]|nr:trehalose-6-phosphate synthase [Candidatus Obscuribacterales bacterium]